MTVFRHITETALLALPGRAVADGLAGDAHFAVHVTVKADNRLGEFGAAGADEPRETDDLARPDLEARRRGTCRR